MSEEYLEYLKNVKPEFRAYADDIANGAKKINPLVTLKFKEHSIEFFIGKQIFAWISTKESRRKGFEIGYFIDVTKDEKLKLIINRLKR
ncbi:MAG: hypothetical protein CEE43_18980 [Promethearchaeota archaeon Loki_b32]|nr:MAG: hypothetical protein CEE43_18980 [Candidatus Lokiarchaeota archaeon Loki_b32]